MLLQGHIEKLCRRVQSRSRPCMQTWVDRFSCCENVRHIIRNAWVSATIRFLSNTYVHKVARYLFAKAIVASESCTKFFKTCLPPRHRQTDDTYSEQWHCSPTWNFVVVPRWVGARITPTSVFWVLALRNFQLQCKNFQGTLCSMKTLLWFWPCRIVSLHMIVKVPFWLTTCFFTPSCFEHEYAILFCSLDTKTGSTSLVLSSMLW